MPTYRISYGGTTTITEASADEMYLQFWRWLRREVDNEKVEMMVVELIEEEEMTRDSTRQASD